MIFIDQMDCLEAMRGMADNLVDFVFYDPPYNVKKKYDGYDDNLSPEEYYIWMETVASEAQRISKRGIVVYIGYKLLHQFFNILPEAHMIVVHQRAAGVFSGNFIVQYHALMCDAKPVKKCKDLWNDIRIPGEGYFFREPRYDHPGLTGLEMTKKVLENFTKEGETVFDPFAGVGTTAVACQLMNRNFMGTEQSKKYVEIAKKRLMDAEPEISGK